jgi:unsaturated chondroitin disaccharide hydrolase
VPYWDFQAPGIPDADTDSSAAAIAADGLLQLSRVDPSRTRRLRDARAADSILWSLAHSYVAPDGQATLTGATATHGVTPSDIGTSYGDFYLMQAVEQWLQHGRR